MLNGFGKTFHTVSQVKEKVQNLYDPNQETQLLVFKKLAVAAGLLSVWLHRSPTNQSRVLE